jgi:uncharacterized protein YeeX (DUF496 family)
VPWKKKKELSPINFESCIESLLVSFDQLALNYQQSSLPKQLQDQVENPEDDVQQQNKSQRNLERLTDTCWKIVDRQKKTEIADALQNYYVNHSPEDGSLFFLMDRILKSKSFGYINHVIFRVPSSFYPKIGFELIKNSRFSRTQKKQVLSMLCWLQDNYDRKRVLKLFKSYCDNPEKYNNTIKPYNS